MFCPQCGTPTRDDQTFCPDCGTVLAASRGVVGPPTRPGGLLGGIQDPGIRLVVYSMGALLAVLIVAEIVKAVVALAVPVLIVLALVYWARQRRRRFY